jgi:hypothetical protein
VGIVWWSKGRGGAGQQAREFLSEETMQVWGTAARRRRMAAATEELGKLRKVNLTI